VIYFDTSYLLRCYYDDPGCEAVRRLADQDQLTCCGHGRVELAAALHRKLREGALTKSAVTMLLRQIQHDSSQGHIVWFPVTEHLLDEAARQYETLAVTVFLRAADSLYLTCARLNGLAEIYSDDQRLLAAASHFGLKGVDVI